MEKYKIIKRLEKGAGKTICEIVKNPGMGFEFLVRILENLTKEDTLATMDFLKRENVVNLDKTFDLLIWDYQKRGYIRESEGSTALMFDKII